MTEEQKYWVAFSVIDGIGPARFKLLKNYFKTVKDIYFAPKKELIKVGLAEDLVDKLASFREKFDLDSYIIRLEKSNIRAINYEQQDYPSLLKQTVNPPIIIYVRTAVAGDIGCLFSYPAMAVVGTRKVTPYGKQVTQLIAGQLAQNGFSVVSGLALGVDGVAHQSAIESNGKTIAVMGCGLDQVYPSSHRQLANQILESGGAWVSEYPIGIKALPGNFPARNRIISGLSLGVVVTEAAEDSGSLITARCATEQGRDVFAVPGPITSQVSGGTMTLLKQGAIPVASLNDILDYLPGFKKTGVTIGGSGENADLTKDELAVVDVLKNGDLTLDEIGQILNLSTEILAGILSMLEVKGAVVGEDGKYYIKK